MEIAKLVSWLRSGMNFYPGPGNASKWLPGPFWYGFLAWAWKCFKMASWSSPGATSRSGLGNASKWLPGVLLERLFGLGLEMLQNGLLELSWSAFSAWAWLGSQWLWPGNVSKSNLICSFDLMASVSNFSLDCENFGGQSSEGSTPVSAKRSAIFKPTMYEKNEGQ